MRSEKLTHDHGNLLQAERRQARKYKINKLMGPNDNPQKTFTTASLELAGSKLGDIKCAILRVWTQVQRIRPRLQTVNKLGGIKYAELWASTAIHRKCFRLYAGNKL